MPTTIFTPQMLRNGTRAVPEIPAGGGGGFTNTYSFVFDGVDNRIDTDSIDLGLENTISFWAKRNGTNFNGVVWGGIVQSNYYTVFLNNGNQIQYRVGGFPVATFSDTNITTTIGADSWFHCALVRNNSGADVLCYMNGVLRQTITGIASSTNNTIVKNIGARGPSPLDFEITGNLDELSLYNTGLSASQISDIYNSGAPNDLTSLSPLHWYRMGDSATWDGSNWTLADQGSGGVNGTSVNMTESDRVEDVPS
jgi:hypothetical protein